MKLSFLGALTAGAVGFGWPLQAVAESVDSELLLLVDSTQRGLNNRDFDQMLDGFADAFTSSAVIDSIQSGAYGRIAVSLMFFGNAGTQAVGVPWMSIGNAAEAETFAAILRAMERPPSPGSIQIDDALLAAIPFFGSETGGSGNGFESVVQMVEVVAASTPAGNSTAGVPQARDQALASGVEVINAISVGKGASGMAAYYANNVIGGEAGGVVATSSSSAMNANLSNFLAGQISEQVSAGAAESLSSVPEPSSILILVSGLGLLCLRRRPVR